MFRRTVSNGGYLQIPYNMPNSINKPNLQYTSNLTTQKYQCANLYIFKKTHDILGIGYDAELIIENKNVNNNNKIYCCFLLKNTRFSNVPKNDIDKLLEASINPPVHYDDMRFDFETLIGKQPSIIEYNSGVDKVLIFATPISIRETNFTKYNQISSLLMKLFPDKGSYGLIQMRAVEGFQEGYEMMDCQLIDDTGKTKGNNVATRLMTTNSKENNAILMSNLFTLSVLIFSGWFIAPTLYKPIIVEHNKTTSSLTFSSIFIGILIFLLGIVLFINGLQYDKTESIVGMLLLLFLVVSSASIILKRIDPFFITPNNGSSVNFDDKNTFNTFVSGFYPMIIKTIALISKYPVGQLEKEPMYLGIFPWIGILLVALFTICFVGIKNDKAVKQKDSKTRGYKQNLIGLILGFGIIYGIMFIIYCFQLTDK